MKIKKKKRLLRLLDEKKKSVREKRVRKRELEDDEVKIELELKCDDGGMVEGASLQHLLTVWQKDKTKGICN